MIRNYKELFKFLSFSSYKEGKICIFEIPQNRFNQKNLVLVICKFLHAKYWIVTFLKCKKWENICDKYCINVLEQKYCGALKEYQTEAATGGGSQT